MGVYLFEDWSDEEPAETHRRLAVGRLDTRRLRNDARLKMIVQDAAFAYDTAAAAITLIDGYQQLILASAGLRLDTSPREDAICDVTIQQPETPLIIRDARIDPRFNWKAAVLMPPHVRFYAGVAIVDVAGNALGALCVFDQAPRAYEIDTFALSILAKNARSVICEGDGLGR